MGHPPLGQSARSKTLTTAPIGGFSKRERLRNNLCPGRLIGPQAEHFWPKMKSFPVGRVDRSIERAVPRGPERGVH